MSPYNGNSLKSVQYFKEKKKQLTKDDVNFIFFGETKFFGDYTNIELFSQKVFKRNVELRQMCVEI